MASSSMSALLLVAVAFASAGLGAALSPGREFPFYDQCRRGQDHQLRNVTALPPKKFGEDGTMEFCFRVDLLAEKCEPEIFYIKKRKVVSRCCDTTFTKIKLYTNTACRFQFAPGQLTVPLAPEWNKIVSPVWEHLNTNYTSIKYTQFGPVPQKSVAGTTFCIRVRPPTGVTGSTCNVNSGLGGITSPFNSKLNIFQVAIYDKKVNDYECCTRFTYNTTTATTKPKRSARSYARFM